MNKQVLRILEIADVVGTGCHTGGVQALVTAYGQAG